MLGLGTCLTSTGDFETAREWCERAVEIFEKGDARGRVNHPTLGLSVASVGYCLFYLGRFDEARAWHERAVVVLQEGDRDGRVDYERLGASQHDVGNCLRKHG